jgi:hypothetical protein
MTSSPTTCKVLWLKSRIEGSTSGSPPLEFKASDSGPSLPCFGFRVPQLILYCTWLYLFFFYHEVNDGLWVLSDSKLASAGNTYFDPASWQSSTVMASVFGRCIIMPEEMRLLPEVGQTFDRILLSIMILGDTLVFTLSQIFVSQILVSLCNLRWG